MYSEQEKELYFLDKFLLSVMFDNDQESYKSTPLIYDVDVLHSFKRVISAFANNGFIKSHIKDNIFKILVDARNIKDEKYEERIAVINEIIGIVNKQNKDLSIVFYLEELRIRRNNTKKVQNIIVWELEEEVPYVDESIYSDFLVLLSHSNNVPQEKFEEEFLNDFVNNSYYYESLNMILKECPSMFKDEIFAKRVNQVLSYNRCMNRPFRKTHKEMKKLVKKYR